MEISGNSVRIGNNKSETLARLHEIGLIAVIRGPDLPITLRMVAALIAGGVKGIEITFSTPQATQVVSQLNKLYGEEILLGMGTLTDASQVDEAKNSGAGYLVSPICEPNLSKAMASSGLPVMIGALTPTEVYQAYQLGADVVKIFPGSLVGPAYIKALKGPFPYIQMMPTGGVSVANLIDWFAAGVFAVGAGSELCPPNLAKAGRFDEISCKAQEFTRAVAAAQAIIKS